MAIDFKKPYEPKELVKFLGDFLPDDFGQTIEPININDLSFKPDRIKKVNLIGQVPSLENLHVYEIEHESESDPRVTLSRETFRLMSNYGVKKALAIFISKNSPDYRFSLATIDLKLEGSRVTKDYSNPRRYSFFLGPDAKIHTPTKYLITNGRIKDLNDLQNRFSIEVVTKEFFTELSNWYFWALKNIECPKDAEEEKNGRNIFAIRLITRLIFIWFMKHKGLIPENLFNNKYLKSILKDLSPNKTTYYKTILQNLFFATLNTPIKERDFRTDKTPYGINKDFMNHNVYRFQNLFINPEDMKSIFNNIPFLNGGLFECLDRIEDKGKYIRIDGFSDREDSQANVPNDLFFSEEHFEDLNQDYGTKNKNYKVRGIIDLLQTYNFTIDESTPVDVEIALDPELLGRVFENLLASYNPETATTARKSTGSYYTPREIVDYMVTQSLKEYFKTKLPNIENIDDKVNNLLSYDSDETPFNENEADTLINSVNNLKIIDPAVGSGAFPMGILQKLVLVLSKLDLHNRQWKKHLIQNCIYGVDIQPIAIQIAKLRFFISLLVDEKIDREQENYGIEPLPNLELKFISANSLIGLTLKGQLDLKDLRLPKLEEDLKRVREIYFRTSAINEKEKLRKEDEKIRNKISALLKESGLPSEDTKRIAEWDPYNSNKSADWFNPEWMFGIKSPSPSEEGQGEGGFDIVIANPPYVSYYSRESAKTANTTKELSILREKFDFTKYERKTGRLNLWMFFAEKFVKLLRINGASAFIVDVNFTKDLAKNIRRYLLENMSIKQFIHDLSEFEYVASGQVILIAQKDNDVSHNKILIKSSLLGPGVQIQQSGISAPDYSFFVLTTDTIISKLSKETKLGELKQLQLTTGIQVGGIEIYKGKPIKDYFYKTDWDYKNVFPAVDPKSVRRYSKSKFERGIVFDYELASKITEATEKSAVVLRKYKDFLNNEKILIRQSASEILATIAAPKTCGEYSLFSLISNDKDFNIKYLLALFNSKLYTYFAVKSGIILMKKGTQPQIRKSGLEKLPIKRISLSSQKPFIDLVDKILTNTKDDDYLDNSTKQAKVKEYEHQIDEMVYTLYGLTEEEIKIVANIKEQIKRSESGKG